MIEAPQAAQCFRQIAELLRATTQGLTAREKLVLQAGLKASHAEEALAQGDLARAQAHFVGLLALAAEIRRMPPGQP